MPSAEGDDEDSAKDELKDDAPVGPGILVAAIGKGEQKAHDDTENHESSNVVEAFKFLPSRLVPRSIGFWWGCGRKEENHSGGSKTSNREIDVETPSPSDMLSEDTTEKGTDHGRYDEDEAEGSKEGGSLLDLNSSMTVDEER